MERRTFITRGLALVGGGVAAGLAGIGPARAAPTTLISQSFSDLGDTDAGWGGQWFSQRYGRAWGVKDGLAFFEMPDPQFGAAKSFPNPVLVLDQDVADVDVKARMSSRNPNARFGLIARAVSYGDFYAAYVDGMKLIVSRFSGKKERMLATGDLPPARKIRLSHSTGGSRSGPGDTSSKGVAERYAAAPLLARHCDRCKRSHNRARPLRRAVHARRLGGLESQREDIELLGILLGGRPPLDPQHHLRVCGPDNGGRRDNKSARGRQDIDTRGRSVPVEHRPAFATYQTTPVLNPQSKLCVVKAWLTDLPRATRIHWRAVSTATGGGIAESAIKSLNTPPGKDQALSFAFGSCTDYETPTRSCEVAAALNPDLFVHLGDFGYAMTGAEAAGFRTADAYQDRWGRMLASSSVGRALDKMPWIMLQDDQDYGKGNCWSGNVPEFSIGAWNAISGNLKQRYFDMQFGDAHFFFIDTHRWADDPKAPDGPGRTILGSAQKSWLKHTMADSDAALKVLFSPLPFRHMEMSYSEEYAELLAFLSSIQSHGRRVLVCAGNSHLHNLARRRPASGGRAVNAFVSSGSDKTTRRARPT